MPCIIFGVYSQSGTLTIYIFSKTILMSLLSHSSNVKELLVNVQSALLIQKFVLNSSSVLFMECCL